MGRSRPTELFIPFSTVGSLASEIKRLREDVGMTQGELAEASGVSRRWINQCEKGHTRGEIGKLMMVTRALGLRVRFERGPESKI